MIALLSKAIPLILFFVRTAAAAPIPVIEIRGTINPAVASYLQRAIEEAEKRQTFLLVELDTPGGLVSSTRAMAQSIDRSAVPVVMFVSPAGASATSAGALLMISSHVAAMAPGTNIGAAHPVGAQGEEIEGSPGEKAVNDIEAFARGMAGARDRNATVAGEVVSKSRSLTAEEARREKLIDAVVADRTGLLKAIDGRQIRVRNGNFKIAAPENSTFESFSMTPGERLLHVVAHPNVAALLMSLGLLLLYAEMSSPGLGLPGIAGVLCLLVGFVAFQAIEVRTGAMILVFIGAALVVAEFFMGTGGVAAFGGAVAFILGMLWLVDPEASDLRISPMVHVVSGGLLLLGGGVIAFAAARTRRLTAAALAEVGGGGLEGLAGYPMTVESVAADGRGGKLRVRGELWNFTSEEPVKIGDRVEPIETNGLRLSVRPAKGRN